MPHFILKVNPINTEITLEDKLHRRAFFFLITIAGVSGFILHRQGILIGTSYILAISLTIILAWNKVEMKEMENMPINLIPLKYI